MWCEDYNRFHEISLLVFSEGHRQQGSTAELRLLSLGLSCASFFSWLTERIWIWFPHLSAKMFRVLPPDKTPDFRYTWGAPSLIILFHTSKETRPHLRSWYAIWKDDSMQYIVIGLHPCGMNKPNTYGSCRNNLDIPELSAINKLRGNRRWYMKITIEAKIQNASRKNDLPKYTICSTYFRFKLF